MLGNGRRGCSSRLLTVEEGNEEAKGNGIEVLEKIIGCSVESHGPGLGDEVIPHLVPTDEVEREEQEHLDAIVSPHLEGHETSHLPCSS